MTSKKRRRVRSPYEVGEDDEQGVAAEKDRHRY
jgi:hypothetical protein